MHGFRLSLTWCAVLFSERTNAQYSFDEAQTTAYVMTPASPVISHPVTSSDPSMTFCTPFHTSYDTVSAKSYCTCSNSKSYSIYCDGRCPWSTTPPEVFSIPTNSTQLALHQGDDCVPETFPVTGAPLEVTHIGLGPGETSQPGGNGGLTDGADGVAPPQTISTDGLPTQGHTDITSPSSVDGESSPSETFDGPLPSESGGISAPNTSTIPSASPGTNEVPSQSSVMGEVPSASLTNEVPSPSTGTEEAPPQPPVTGEVPLQSPGTDEVQSQSPVAGEVPSPSSGTSGIPAQSSDIIGSLSSINTTPNIPSSETGILPSGTAGSSDLQQSETSLNILPSNTNISPILSGTDSNIQWSSTNSNLLSSETNTSAPPSGASTDSVPLSSTNEPAPSDTSNSLPSSDTSLNSLSSGTSDSPSPSVTGINSPSTTETIVSSGNSFDTPPSETDTNPRPSETSLSPSPSGSSLDVPPSGISLDVPPSGSSIDPSPPSETSLDLSSSGISTNPPPGTSGNPLPSGSITNSLPSDTGVVDPPPSETGVVDPPPSETGVVDPPPSETGVVDPPPSETGVVDPPPSDTTTEEGETSNIIITAIDGSSTTDVDWVSTRVSSTSTGTDGVETVTETDAWGCTGSLCDPICLIPVLCPNLDPGDIIDGFPRPTPPPLPPRPGPNPVNPTVQPTLEATSGPTDRPTPLPTTNRPTTASDGDCEETAVPSCFGTVSVYTASNALTLITETISTCTTLTTCGLGQTTLTTTTLSSGCIRLPPFVPEQRPLSTYAGPYDTNPPRSASASGTVSGLNMGGSDATTTSEAPSESSQLPLNSDECDNCAIHLRESDCALDDGQCLQDQCDDNTDCQRCNRCQGMIERFANAGETSPPPEPTSTATPTESSSEAEPEPTREPLDPSSDECEICFSLMGASECPAYDDICLVDECNGTAECQECGRCEEYRLPEQLPEDDPICEECFSILGGSECSAEDEQCIVDECYANVWCHRCGRCESLWEPVV